MLFVNIISGFISVATGRTTEDPYEDTEYKSWLVVQGIPSETDDGDLLPPSHAHEYNTFYQISQELADKIKKHLVLPKLGITCCGLDTKTLSEEQRERCEMRSENHPALWGLYCREGGLSYRACMSGREKRAMIQEYDKSQALNQKAIDGGFFEYRCEDDATNREFNKVFESKPVEHQSGLCQDLEKLLFEELEYKEKLNESLANGDLFECDECGNIWDGNAQCYPCVLLD